MKIIIKIIENLKLIINPVIINAFVFFDKTGKVRQENWGDDINYFFLKEIVRRPIVLLGRTSLANRLNLKNYLVIGSTIDMLCKKNTEVWGGGIINGDVPLKHKPKKVYAVRGPLTYAKLVKEGIKCPRVYGDPALLVSLYYRPQCVKRYRYGFIFHVSNKKFVDEIKIDGEPIRSCKDVCIIDLSEYRHWHDIIDLICCCNAILSSSLHGLIIAESYGIPNLWIESGNPLIGGHFKFHDFFLSINRDRKAPYVIRHDSMSSEDIDKELSSWEKGYLNLTPLIESCPFRIHQPKFKDAL